MADSRKYMNNNESFLEDHQSLFDSARYFSNQAKTTCHKLSNLQQNLHSEIDCLIAKGADIRLTADEKKYLDSLRFNAAYSQYLEKQLQSAMNQLKNNFVLFAGSEERLQLTLKAFIAEQNDIETKMNAQLNALAAKGAFVSCLLSEPVTHQSTSTNNNENKVEAMVNDFETFQAETKSAETKSTPAVTTTSSLAKVNQRVQQQFRLLGLTQQQPSNNSQQQPSDNAQQRVDRARQMHELIKSVAQVPNCRSRF